MAKTVRIRLKKSPENKRTITERSWANYRKNEWELDTDQVISQNTEAKKKDVGVAAVSTTAKGAIPVVELVQTPIVPTIQNDDLGDSNEFVNPVQDASELDTLREQYEAKFGKPADKRLKEEKLKSLIDETV